MYPYIRNFKFGTQIFESDITLMGKNEKVKVLLWLMKKGCILRVNEKLLLSYEEDGLLTENDDNIWSLKCRKVWYPLYERNNDSVNKVRGLARRAEKLLQPLYPSARNLKEYSRLLGRFCRILHEINQLRELRISAANLLNHLEIMLGSLIEYIEHIRDEEYEPKEYADSVEEYLHIGINALENFTRYIRNINLQTLQTPNYDLQTNICVEKMLLAYSQFLQLFMDKTNGGLEECPYYLNDILYPIIIPDMSVVDLSVSVLFNDHYTDIDKEVVRKKLMVVISPTFSYLCETCFLIPTAFHELAHHFRYEKREIRNDNVKKYVLKIFLLSIVKEILDKDSEFLVSLGLMTECIVEDVYGYIDHKIFPRGDKDPSLQYLEVQLEYIINKICVIAKKGVYSPAAIIKYYIDMTKECVQSFDHEIITILTILSELLQDKCAFQDEVKREKICNAFFKYKKVQEKQIINGIQDLLKKIHIDDVDIDQKINVFITEKWKNGKKEMRGVWLSRYGIN